MNTEILASNGGWHVRDLLRAADELNLPCRVVEYRQLSAFVSIGNPSLPDVVMVRTMPLGSLEQVIFRMDVLNQWTQAGVRVVNPPRALETCIDKYLCTARMQLAELPVPPTIVCQTAEEAMSALNLLGNDVVVKPLFGSEGRGMMRVSDEDLGWRTFRTLERQQAVLYLQKFIPNAGWDLRVFLLGKQILAGMRRHAESGWKTNVSLGGRAEAVVIGETEAELAVRAAETVGIDVGGVDLIQDQEGRWYVLEVNAVPGWRGLAKVCQVDVAKELWRYVTHEQP